MKEALKLALAALKQIDAAMPFPVAKLAIMEAEKALAQPEQEPVGEVLDDEIDWFSFVPSAGSLIYTTPPQRKPPNAKDFEDYCKTLHPLWNTRISRTEAEGFFHAGWLAAHGIKE